MKTILFGGLPFPVSSSYRVMRSRVKNGATVTLFGSEEAEVRLFRWLFGFCVELRIGEQSSSAVSRVGGLLEAAYGAPHFIANGSVRIWQRDGVWISHGLEEAFYNCDEHIVRISFRKPCLRLMPYGQYLALQSLLQRLASQWGLLPLAFIAVEGSGAVAWYETKKGKYSVTLRHGRYFVAQWLKANGAVPEWKQKGRYRSTEELMSMLDCVLDYFSEYDETLRRVGDEREEGVL